MWFSNNMLELIFFRGLQGLGGGILMTIPFILVAELFPSPPARKICRNLIFGFWPGKRTGTSHGRFNYKFNGMEMGVLH
jgi:MFS family permease